MDGENEGAPPPRDVSEHTHDLARLPEIEAVERLVHEQQGMRGEQRQRQHQPAGITLRQSNDALA